MKQMGIFSPNESIQKTARDTYFLYIDGAARNNPGPAGVGVYMLQDKQSIVQQGFYVGSKTNNQAEYLALLVGLFFAKKTVQPADHLTIFSDSQLLVRQINCLYKVKNEKLKPLFAIAKKQLTNLSFDIYHIPREKNVMADMLANKGVDGKIPVPAGFINLLDQYGLSV